MKTLTLVLILTVSTTLALEIDEKLTTRFLKVSKSKKTVLLNRGLEDGLVVGDHAKFFLTKGVIARGMVVKASPTRSIWSIYRIVDNDDIFNDKVVNIKITKPLTTTEDPSKSLYDDANATVTAGTDVMTIRGDDGGVPPPTVLTEQTGDEAQKDLDSLGGLDEYSMAATMGESDKTIEAFGMIYFNGLSATVEGGTDSEFNGEDANIDFGVGIEKYFNAPQSWLKNLSLLLYLHSSSNSTTSAQGSQLSQSVLEYGLGLNYHFLAPPLSYGRLIGYGGIGLGVGSVEDTVTFLANTSTENTQTYKGNSSFFSIGIGLKYYLKSGFGMRAFIDYYQRSESYSIEDSDELNKSVAGPRLMAGLSYRF